ncbi:Uncharacterised protein [Bordetella pertussis]|nr:Uncharacterised protein [Bordetella pertussis]
MRAEIATMEVASSASGAAPATASGTRAARARIASQRECSRGGLFSAAAGSCSIPEAPLTRQPASCRDRAHGLRATRTTSHSGCRTHTPGSGQESKRNTT